jgi:H+-translocating NAD(P) transhydrogenase subunit alpha
MEDLIFNLFIFVLAAFVGFELISKVPPTLHTPLMSGANAISGITLIGALIIAGGPESMLRPVDWFCGHCFCHHQRGGRIYGNRPDAGNVQEKGG